MVNWLEVATIAAPIIAAFLGVWATRRFENRPILLSHFGHVSGITLAWPEGPIAINHHSVVIRNTGRRPATYVRLTHHLLPDFNVGLQFNTLSKTFPRVARTSSFPYSLRGSS